MIEIDDLSLNEWYACLKPYQKVVIEQLVSKYGEEKAAEKVEVKGGIHGRLEKAKAEIKAKEADKVPKNKSKDLAAAL